MDTEIVGTIVVDPLDDRLLIYDIDRDTLPQNTIDPVDAVINPLTAGPGAGLPAPIPGRRYLIVENMGGTGSTVAWGNLNAKANDVIEYNGSQWIVSFDSHASTTVQYVLNLNSNIQYRYVPGEGAWMKAYEGFYPAGDFSIVI